jgi:hypothetical protein
MLTSETAAAPIPLNNLDYQRNAELKNIAKGIASMAEKRT